MQEKQPKDQGVERDQLPYAEARRLVTPLGEVGVGVHPSNEGLHFVTPTDEMKLALEQVLPGNVLCKFTVEKAPGTLAPMSGREVLHRVNVLGRDLLRQRLELVLSPGFRALITPKEEAEPA